MDLTHISEHFTQTQKEYTFFSSAHGTFSKTDHIHRHKANLNRYNVYILSDSHGLKLYIRNNRWLTNPWKMNNSLLKEKWVKTKIKKEIKSFLESNENQNMTHPILCDTMKAFLRDKFIVLSAYIQNLEQ